MFNKPYLINSHSIVSKTYDDSQMFLSENPELLKKIANHLWAYHEIGDLIPQTIINFGSGHYFPYSESYYEVEASFEFALLGFYRHSLIALRLVLELGLLGLYFSVGDNEHIEVGPWISSKIRTPNRNEIFKKLLTLQNVQVFDEKFQLKTRILKIFENLDAYTHTRGVKFSSSKLNQSNRNQFNSKSLQLYSKYFFLIIQNLIILYLLKYPIGMKGLPLEEKFGLNGPAGGFLNDSHIRLNKIIIPKEEWCFLQKICDEDKDTQNTIIEIINLPDLSDDQWQKQITEWQSFIKDDNSPDIKMD